MSRDKVPITNFSMLLKTFHITGMEMAEALHVDSSLISKWRTNKRKFRANSQIFEQMIEYVMSLDKASDYAEVRKLLEEDYPDVNAVSKDRLKLYLKKWLIKAVKVEATEVSFLRIRKIEYLCTNFTVHREKEIVSFLFSEWGLTWRHPRNYGVHLINRKIGFWKVSNILKNGKI